MKGKENVDATLARRMALALIDFLLRKRHPSVTLVRVALGFGILADGGWHVLLLFPMADGELGLQIFANEARQGIVSILLHVVTFGLFAWGFAWWWWDERKTSRKRVIVVEVLGLRNTPPGDLAEAVPQSISGRRERLHIDLRQGVQDGTTVSPSAAIEKLSNLPMQLSILQSDFDRSDIAVIYGGLAPVPLTFLAGVLMDDENHVHVLDWDRHASLWRVLDGVDDHERFQVKGLESIVDGEREVVLAVSVSYGIRLTTVTQELSDVSVVQMSLESASADNHWSKEKQEALGRQFLETVMRLGNEGVERIHLFLAAQNSVVFRLGRLYDWRNLPELIVYQYERAAAKPYPWGVLMPTSGGKKAQIVY